MYNPCLTYVLEFVLQARLDAMLFVGLTEKHQESATNFLQLVGNQIDVQSEILNEIVGKNISDPGLIIYLSLGTRYWPIILTCLVLQ